MSYFTASLSRGNKSKYSYSAFHCKNKNTEELCHLFFMILINFYSPSIYLLLLQIKDMQFKVWAIISVSNTKIPDIHIYLNFSLNVSYACGGIKLL